MVTGFGTAVRCLIGSFEPAFIGRLISFSIPWLRNGGIEIRFIALPGIAGNAIYTRVTGTSWREEPWRSMVRIFAISLGGLILYVLVGGLLNAPLPSYLSLETLDTFTLRRAASLRMSLAFLGHLISAMVVGFAAGKISRGLGGTAFAHGWHEFVSVHGSGHWAVVGVQDGTIYAGVIQMADPGKKADGRDVILAEPAVYRADQEKYFSQARSLIRSPLRAARPRPARQPCPSPSRLSPTQKRT